MDARAFNMFHNAGNEYLFPITDRIHFQFHTHQVFVDQHRIFHTVCQNDLHILADILVRKSDDHILTAQHIAGTHQHRITQPARCLQRFFFSKHSIARRGFDSQPIQQLVEPAAILRRINAVGWGTEDRHAVFHQALGQLDRGLTAKRNHSAHRTLHPHNIQHIFGGQRFKIQPVSGIEIGGNRFGVVVDDHHIIARFFE